MIRRSYTWAPVLAVALGLTAGFAGMRTQAVRRAPASPEPQTRFRLGINYVQIDAVVVDRTGRFVRGLDKADFEIREDGRLQTLDALRLIDVEDGGADARRSPPDQADVVSNDGAARGRLYVLVLDDLHTAAGRSARVKDLARLFINRHLQPNDVAAVVMTGAPARGDQDFTSDPQLLLKAVEGFAGTKAASRAITLATLACFNL